MKDVNEEEESEMDEEMKRKIRAILLLLSREPPSRCAGLLALVLVAS